MNAVTKAESLTEALAGASPNVIAEVVATIDRLLAERERLTDALDHIARTCRGSRTQTRRIRFIALRAECAINGREDWRDADMPRNDPLVEKLHSIIAGIFPIAKAELSQLVSGYTTPSDQRAGLTAEQLIETITERQVHDDAIALRRFLLDARRNVPALNVAELNRGEPWVNL